MIKMMMVTMFSDGFFFCIFNYYSFHNSLQDCIKSLLYDEQWLVTET